MANIIVTGGTAGIGRAAAMLLVNKGHTVVACGRDAQALAELSSSHDRLHGVAMDVTDPDSVSTAAVAATQIFGGTPPDVLVNNAGFALVGPLETIDDAEWERQYQTNVLGLVRVTRAFLPAMRDRRKGRIVNVSSVAGRVTLPFFAPYNSTKHAVESISDSLRTELYPHGIDVVTIEPGAVKTRFGSLEQAQIERWIEEAPAYADQLRTLKAFHHDLHGKGADPTAVAGCIVRACEDAKPYSRQVTPLFPGAAFIALKAWLPTPVSDWIVRRLTGLDKAGFR
jgi:NAD(P)-dependent dehydrogenase (short-subunit alcohol dehydrogenase family)